MTDDLPPQHSVPPVGKEEAARVQTGVICNVVDPLPNPLPPTIHTWIDTTNKLAQIAALLVAGVWTWNVFARTSAPGLEPKLGLRSELTWIETGSSNSWKVSFHVFVKNEGQRNFEVTGVEITAHLLDASTLGEPPETGDPISLDYQLIESKGTELRLGNTESYWDDLSGHYSPGTQNDSDTTFLFKKLPNRLIEFRAQLDGKESKVLLPFATKQTLTNYTVAEDKLCGETAGDAKH
jgi:hypothetical protein